MSMKENIKKIVENHAKSKEITTKGKIKSRILINTAKFILH